MIKNIIKRIIVAIVVGIFFMTLNSCKVNAASLSPSGFSDTRNQVYGFNSYAQDGYLFYYPNTTLQLPKMTVVYNTTNIDRNKKYTFSAIVKMPQNGPTSYAMPIALFGGVTCNVNPVYANGEYIYIDPISSNLPGNTNYNFNYAFYTIFGNYLSIVCDEVSIVDNTSYLDLMFGTEVTYCESNTCTGPNINLFGIGPLFYQESSLQNVVNAISSNQQQIQNLNNTMTTVNNSTQQVNQSVQDVNDSINDDNVDSPGSAITDNSNKVATNGVISDLVTLPITLFQNILNAISGSCQSFELGTLYNYNLVMPCINLQNILGSTIYTIIDIICSGFFVYFTGRKMIDIFNNLSQLKEGDLLK